MSQVITPELRLWIVEQAQAGHGVEAVLQAMKASGWHEDTAIAALEDTLQAHVEGSRGPDLQRQAQAPMPCLRTDTNEIWAHDRAVRIVSSLAHPRIVVLADVLSPQECAALRTLASERLVRSETVVHTTGGSEVNAARTSEGMFFNRGECELVERIEARLAALVQWPVERGEGLQVLRYAPGAEYRPHYDYFDPAQPGTVNVLKRGGQRVATLVLYLNTPPEGGATVFPDIDLAVHPMEGSAVFFSYDRPDPATGTLHGGAPVIRGEKWVATKWLREGRFD